MRYNLVNSGIVGPRLGAFLTSVLPWLLSWLLYQGQGIMDVFEWGGLVLNGLVGFILPLALAVYAVSRRTLKRRSSAAGAATAAEEIKGLAAPEVSFEIAGEGLTAPEVGFESAGEGLAAVEVSFESAGGRVHPHYSPNRVHHSSLVHFDHDDDDDEDEEEEEFEEEFQEEFEDEFEEGRWIEEEEVSSIHSEADEEMAMVKKEGGEVEEQEGEEAGGSYHFRAHCNSRHNFDTFPTFLKIDTDEKELTALKLLLALTVVAVLGATANKVDFAGL